MLDRLLGENITDMADGRFAIARERGRIRYVTRSRRLDERLVHVVVEMMAIGTKVNLSEVVD